MIKGAHLKLHRNIEEEEKVPNEHPPKRHSIGLGYYQTNYFSQAGADQNRFIDGNLEEECKEGDESLVQLERRKTMQVPIKHPKNVIEHKIVSNNDARMIEPMISEHKRVPNTIDVIN